MLLLNKLLVYLTPLVELRNIGRVSLPSLPRQPSFCTNKPKPTVVSSGTHTDHYKDPYKWKENPCAIDYCFLLSRSHLTHRTFLRVFDEDRYALDVSLPVIDMVVTRLSGSIDT